MATILIIDDNDDFRGMLRTKLEKEGYEVREAVDGKKGVESYKGASDGSCYDRYDHA